MRATAVLSLMAMVSGCFPPPKQAGGLEVFDHRGLGRRMRILCRLGVGERQLKAACLSPAPQRSIVVDHDLPARETPKAKQGVSER